MNISPFTTLIIQIINLYELAVTIWMILSWLVAFNIINHNQPLVKMIMYYLNQVIDPVLNYIRRIMPNLGGLDISAIILFLLLGFVKNCLLTYF